MKPFITLFTILGAIISFSAAAQPLPYYVPTDELAAWYSFSGNANDNSGNGNNFTVYGATTPTTDRFGNAASAYNFSGSAGSYMRAPTILPSTLNPRNGSFTIAAWYKLARLSNPTDMQIFWRGDLAFASDQYMLYFSGGVPAFRRDVNTGTTTNNINYPLFTPDTAAFHHLAGVYDSTAGTMTIYFDGTLVSRASRSGNALYNTFVFFNTIGAVETGNSQNFAGKLDDIGLWSRALNDCEITRLYYADTSLISRQPAHVTAAAGSVATFSINDVSSYALYQWQIDSTGTGYTNLYDAPPYSGVNTKTLTISNVTDRMNGLYYRCMRSGGGCTEASAERRLTVGPTAVKSFEQSSGFSIYPNPNAGRFTIASKQHRGIVSLEIGDVMGRRLVAKEYNLKGGVIHVDLTDKLVPGVYVLKLIVEDEVYATQITVR